jgi:hypothetical protein
VSYNLGLIIEGLVAILLLVTIGYCVVLNKRLKRLRADEQSLKATISELITATEIAERAIHGLKITVRDCDASLGERLRTAERFGTEIVRQVKAGEEVLARIAKIAVAARPAGSERVAPVAPVETKPASTIDAKAMVAAAQAFAERARSRVHGLAA